jgi:co-chaperonin GroES (HSP10)
MLQPRNTFVVLELIEKAERRVGKITVPTKNDMFCEAEVIAIGPGTCLAAGAQSELRDLKIGQRVWVKAKSLARSSVGGVSAQYDGIEYLDGDRKLYVFEQNSIVAIIAEAQDNGSNSEPISLREQILHN